MKKYKLWEPAISGEFVADLRYEMEQEYPYRSDTWWEGFAEETNREYLNDENWNMKNTVMKWQPWQSMNKVS